MAAVEITELKQFPLDRRLRALRLKRPEANGKSNIQAFEVSGWVVSKDSPAVTVRCLYENALLKVIPLLESPPEVFKELPDLPREGKYGFWGTVGTVGLPSDFEIRLVAVLENDQRVPLGSLQVRQEPLRSDFEPTVQPILLSSLGRTGTTWVMRLLAHHPAIVVHQVYPYETRAAAYWMHTLKVLSDPADHRFSAHPVSFHVETKWTGNHPFYFREAEGNSNLEEIEGINRWFGQDYFRNLVRFCQQSIESYYLEVAKDQHQERPTYFAEKYPQRGPIPWVTWNLYPKTREVFLLRDPRDTLCSILAFNAKRGFASFGREAFNSDEEYVKRLRGNFENLLQNWKSRADRTFKVRYEDLILRPHVTLVPLLEYLNLDRSPAVLEHMLRSASEPDKMLAHHLTSTDPKASVGRWQRDLSDSLKAVCAAEFGGLLEEMGYPV